MDVTSESQTREAFVQHWLDEIAKALKHEKDFRKEGIKLVELYEGGKKTENQFNILYSNTETLAPALYNSVPRPVVERRFKDEDPLGKMAAQAGQRILEYLIDDGMPEYSTFDDLMKSAVLEALVPGRGLSVFKYDAEIEKVRNVREAEQAEAVGEVEDPGEETEREGHDPAPQEYEDVKYETVCGEEMPWNRVLHGYAKKWKDVPWLAFEYLMTKEELEKNFGAMGSRVPVAPQGSENSTTIDEESTQEDTAGTSVAPVYAIWDKSTRKVIFISPNYKDFPLKEVDDPLQLSGFYPCPKPLGFMAKISSLVPVALYTQYEEQAKELNRVTVRINKLINALKVRGMYDATVQGLEKVFEAEDNVLIPVENVAGMQATGGQALEKAIWTAPIEKLVPVLQQLYQQRREVKQVIYEITGIADIMRGTTQASETLGAQELKNQWGTLRLKRFQKEVARYARDCLRIMLEIAVTKLSEDTLQRMTGLPFPTGAQKEQLQQQVQQLAVAGMQPPPELVQALEMPGWPEILNLLRDDLQRNYRIDIETNSTVDAEATEDKQNIAELLNAISQFLNGVAPLVEQGSMPFEVAQGMLLAIVRRFRFGPELEDQLKAMKQPEPKPDPKMQAEQAKAQQEQQKFQLEMQRMQADFQIEQQRAQMELEIQRQKLEMERERMMLEMAAERERLQLEAQSHRQKAVFSEQQHQMKLRQMAQQTAAKPAGNTTQ